jgi:biopolymer transport protein ExbD
MPKAVERPNEIAVVVSATGQCDQQDLLAFTTIDAWPPALKGAGGEQKDPVVVISADAPPRTSRCVMEAARAAGYAQITFTTQAQAGK